MSMTRQIELTKFLNCSLSGERYFKVRQAIINDIQCDLKYDFGRFMCGTFLLSEKQINRIWEIIDETYE